MVYILEKSSNAVSSHGFHTLLPSKHICKCFKQMIATGLLIWVYCSATEVLEVIKIKLYESDDLLSHLRYHICFVVSDTFQWVQNCMYIPLLSLKKTNVF